ncbi:MAG TPA: hypothetical protein PLT34_07310 [Muribaculaceae bacterium]|nr:hypothetical protein [Muribaculaceae bacterium]
MKAISIEIPNEILAALAANPNDPQLASEVCSAIVKAAEILSGTSIEPSSAKGNAADAKVIVDRANKIRERRKAAALRRAQLRQQRERNLTRLLASGIHDTRLSDLKSLGVLSTDELRIIEAMLRPTIQLTNKLTAKQLAAILSPRLHRLIRRTYKQPSPIRAGA